MSSISKIFTAIATLALFALPLAFAHAQVYSNGYYPTSSYNTSYYPTTYPTSNQYYNNGYSSNGYNGYYPYSYPSPTCTLSITAPTSYGSSVNGTVSWTTQNASSVYLTNAGNEPAEGSVSVYMYPGETFTLTMSGPGGSSSCQNTYYPTQQQQYGYGYGYGTPSYTQPYYSTPTTYYPSYPSTYVAPTTYYPIYPTQSYNQPVNNYNPISWMSNWFSNVMHW